MIRDAGAIPFVRSNLPCGVIGNENWNFIYGTINNFHDKSRTPGGSSGGEAALVSSGCSPLGFCSDAAGSARTPAIFSGVVGFMPSNTRLTTQGMAAIAPGNHMMRGNAGITAKSVRDVNLVLAALVNNKKMLSKDHTISGIPYQISEFSTRRKYKIAVVPSPPKFDNTKVQDRALRIAVESLRSRGHEVIDLRFPEIYASTTIFLKIASNLGGIAAEIFDDEFLAGEGQLLKNSRSIPNWVFTALKKILPKLGKRFDRASHGLQITGKLN